MEEYEPIKVLGEGSFGKVYLMKHEKTKELVCTKVIRLKNIPAKEQVACRNEVEMLRRMCHPNIVGYTNSLIYKNCLCIIMEYCDAGDLGDRVKEAKDILFAESKIMTWFVQITLGLHYMHTNRILHRDIKTQNVFILSSGRLVLGDLGISKLLASTRDFTSTCIGTPYYMSPEIFKNNPYNDKSDVWALGCLLYELLTLKHAFDAQSLNGLVGKIIKGKFPPISTQYSKSLRALVNDMLSTNPKKRPDTEQILRKPFVQMKVKQFVADLNSETLHREEEAMDNLSDQLLDLRMADAVPEKNLLVDTRLDDEGGPNAPSPSESDTAAAAAAAAAVASASTRSGPRFQLRVQKHQLELEEEKRMAAEMALKRLKKKTAERQRRATLSLSESPIAGGSTGVGKTLNAETPRSPGSPNGGGDDADSPPGRGRKLSLLQRLSYITTSSSLSRKKAMSTPTSPSETVDSSLSPSHSNREKRRPKGTARKNDVNRAVALTLAEAEATETVKQMDAGPERNGVLAAKAATPPNSLPQRSLAGPKEATESVSATTPRRRSMSGSDAIDNIASYKPPSDILAGKDKTNGGSGGSGSSGKNMRRPQRGKLPRLNIDSGSSSPTADVLYSGPRSARSSEDSTEGTSQHTTSESLKPEEDADLFQTLKKQAKAHAREGEDKEIHDREEELRVRLREAERRCRDLQVNMQRVQETAGSLSGPAVVASIPPPVPVMVASRPLDPMQPPAIQNETHGVGAGSDDCSLTGPCVVDDRYFDVNWETVPYCESHMEEIHDPPSPVDELADRVKVLTKKCIEGLGQKNFEMALELLKRMQEGDCKVIVEGVVYDGNDEGDVEKALERVIGKLKLHYWHLLDQLLLMT